MAIEIVDFPIKTGGAGHSFLYVYQRVEQEIDHLISPEPSCSPDSCDQKTSKQRASSKSLLPKQQLHTKNYTQ
jgi:hypothetical protein